MTNEELRTFTHRPTVAEIDLGALRFNFLALKGLAGSAKVMASIKANGYGHGLVDVAHLLQSEGIDAIGVAYIEEAIELREHNVTVPILVFGGLPRDQIELYLRYDVDITASSVTKIQQIDEVAKRTGKRARAHLKIDTGFERIGVHYYSAQSLFDAALAAQHVDVVGVYSHFADVNADDMTLTNLQLERFLEALKYYESRSPQPFLRHIASSAALMVSKATHLDMVRPGLALYGVYPGRGYEEIVTLKPVLSLKSQVVYFKVVKKGAGVSYGHTWHAPEDTRVITIPIGYGDGYLRQLSNKASVIVRGRRCPIVGVVCMDQLMVNIGQGEAYNGDEVVLIGSQGEAQVTVEELAALIDTTPHQILVSLNGRIPRIYKD